MAISFSFFHDSALTQPVDAENPITATQDTTNSMDPVDVQIWFGSTATGMVATAESDPGVDDILVTIVDADDETGEPDTAVSLATSQVGLDTATPGASLSLGTSIESGSANAIAFWVRIDDATEEAGAYTDLSLVTNDLAEDPA